jgi:hypothetical protein
LDLVVPELLVRRALLVFLVLSLSLVQEYLSVLVEEEERGQAAQDKMVSQVLLVVMVVLVVVVL